MRTFILHCTLTNKLNIRYCAFRGGVSGSTSSTSTTFKVHLIFYRVHHIPHNTQDVKTGEDWLD